jgi:hypothetical protein
MIPPYFNILTRLQHSVAWSQHWQAESLPGSNSGITHLENSCGWRSDTHRSTVLGRSLPDPANAETYRRSREFPYRVNAKAEQGEMLSTNVILRRFQSMRLAHKWM